ncbi:MAG: homoserine kinase [Planctomycetota bacterium]|jgi:homoserine kinase
MTEPPAGQLSVSVAASTSNLGPGFDMLGLALSIPLQVEARITDGPVSVYADREGEARTWPSPPHEILIEAYQRVGRELGVELPALALSVRSEIPIGRGLGSSGAAITAGLLLGEHLARRATADACDRDPNRTFLVQLGAELEGHPDNSTASLLGGMTLAVPHAEGIRVLRPELSPVLGFSVAWPASPLPTQLGRDALPDVVPLSDAIENPRRLALLLEGLRTADPGLVTLGAHDRLHERFRLPLIRGGAEALAAAREAGAYAAMISGSGSALIAISARDDRAAIADAMREPLERADGPAHARPVEVMHEAPRVAES